MGEAVSALGPLEPAPCGRKALTTVMALTVEIREKAVEVALAVTSGAYQTTLLTYFIQRDLFPSVMKVRRDLLRCRRGMLTGTVHPRCRHTGEDSSALHARRAARQLQQV